MPSSMFWCLSLRKVFDVLFQLKKILANLQLYPIIVMSKFKMFFIFTRLLLVLLVMSSDPNLYSMVSGTFQNTLYFIMKSHPPWFKVMLLMTLEQLSVTQSLLNFSILALTVPYRGHPKLLLCLGCFLLGKSFSHLPSWIAWDQKYQETMQTIAWGLRGPSSASPSAS